MAFNELAEEYIYITNYILEDTELAVKLNYLISKLEIENSFKKLRKETQRLQSLQKRSLYTSTQIGPCKIVKSNSSVRHFHFLTQPSFCRSIFKYFKKKTSSCQKIQ